MTSGCTARSEPRLGVAGWPVAHSRSPAMQNAALTAAGLSGWRYQLLPIPPQLAEATLRALPQSGFRGVNVTIPHKRAALAVATDPSPRAAAIGAANTLVYGDDGAIAADNTDAPALLETVARVTGADALPESALVLGAGGSARAAVWALRHAGVGEVRIWNRTPARAQALASELGAVAVTEAEPAQLLVNCTAVGLDGSEPFDRLPLAADELGRYSVVADYVYTVSGTRLIDAARGAGAATVDGLELLVAQGALSFTQFTGRPAPLQVMRAAAREADG